MALRSRTVVLQRAALAAALPLLLAVTATRAQYAENFDALAAPALPANWTTASFGFSWVTTTNAPHSPPNRAEATTLDVVSEAYLDSTLINVGATPHLLRFRHRFQLEADAPAGLVADGGALRGLPGPVGYDGGVLEIAIGPGDYQDIIAAGGEFLANGYTLPITNQSGSLISDRQAWSGTSLGLIVTTIRLPPSALNSTIRLRFRLSADSQNGGGFWAIDTIEIVDECISQDTEPPTIVCAEPFSHPGRTYICDDPRLTIGSMLTSITDNCVGDLVVTQDPPEGTQLPPGSTLITVTATDPAGNVAQCSTTLTVVDPVAGQCGICCGAGFVEAFLVTFGSLAGRRLSRRRYRPVASGPRTGRPRFT